LVPIQRLQAAAAATAAAAAAAAEAVPGIPCSPTAGSLPCALQVELASCHRTSYRQQRASSLLTDRLVFRSTIIIEQLCGSQ